MMKMNIAELNPGQGKVDLEAQVIAKHDERTFEKFGKQGKVCNAEIQDNSGKITLTLWNEQVDQVKVGDKVKITNGWVSEWRGEPQLSTGKFGQLEILESAKEDKGEHILTDDEKEEAEIAAGNIQTSTEEATPEDEEPVTEDEQEEAEIASGQNDVPPLEESTTEDQEEVAEPKEHNLSVEEEKVE